MYKKDTTLCKCIEDVQRKYEKEFHSEKRNQSNRLTRILQLFAPPSPLLAIRVPFRCNDRVSVDKPILLGIMEQQLTPTELNIDLVEAPKWRSDAYARLLLAMCRKRFGCLCFLFFVDV